ncbi:Uncharacterised protein [Yersinia bercovieri]|nr:Uncharacterised protein [Yersinia bercovieri]
MLRNTYPHHLSSYRCVGCAQSPKSLTDVSSSGFSCLPPSCNSKSIGDNCHLSSCRCVGCAHYSAHPWASPLRGRCQQRSNLLPIDLSPKSLTDVSSSGFSCLPPSCNSKSIGDNCHLSSCRCVGCAQYSAHAEAQAELGLERGALIGAVLRLPVVMLNGFRQCFF